LIPCIVALALGTAFADIAVEGELPRDYAVSPGQHVEGTIIVVNPGAYTAEAKLYQTDFRFTADGTTYFDAPGSQPRSNAPWVRVTPAILIIPAGQKAMASYSIDVPENPAFSGSYWSIIMVEESRPPVPDPKTTLVMTQNVRYGVQLSVTIGNTGSTNIKFANPQALKEERGTVFSIDLTNTGERMVKPLVNLELYDAEGKSAGKIDSLPYRIYPGTSSRYRFELPVDLPRKTYKVLVIADCGQNKVFGASLNLSLEP
jgi:hypothetical protein